MDFVVSIEQIIYSQKPFGLGGLDLKRLNYLDRNGGIVVDTLGTAIFRFTVLSAVITYRDLQPGAWCRHGVL